MSVVHACIELNMYISNAIILHNRAVLLIDSCQHLSDNVIFHTKLTEAELYLFHIHIIWRNKR